MQNDQTDDLDSVIGLASYEAARPIGKKDFLPWHRPRKQFVRDKQWREQIHQIIPELSADHKPLKYLGLPGTDLLDLRYFHDSVCRIFEIPLFYIGFNSGATPSSPDGIELNTSLDEVNKLPFIQPGSDVITADFRNVANNESYAYKQISKHGPYDIINLDLCDGFACQAPGAMEANHYNAMNQILSIQARRKNPWLLFLTTRTGLGHVNQEVMNQFIRNFNEYLVRCEAFRNTSNEHFRISANEELIEAIKSSKGLGDVFLCGLCKWILGITLGQIPPTKVEVKSALGYRVEHNADDLDLVSLAIKFTPISPPAHDPLGLANNHAAPLSGCDIAPIFVRKLAQRRDVDSFLSSNKELMQQMVTDMAALLELARYDITEFHKWVANGCPHKAIN